MRRILSIVVFSLSLATHSAFANADISPLPTLSKPAASSMHPTVIPASPQLGAAGYVLLDFNSGKIIAEKNAHEKREPASLTKIMTTYVVDQEIKNGKIKPTDMVLISENAWRTGGSRTFLEVGKQFQVDELLKGAIIQSGNDASVALAEHVAGSEQAFADLMNHYAKELGMNDSHFENATGLPGNNHYTTPYDLALLSRALIQNFPESYKTYSEKWHTFNGIRQPNRNLLLWRDPSVDGIKTGFTDPAGYCLAASSVRNGMRLISIVLGSSDPETRAKESQQLLSYGFRFYETKRLFAANETLNQPRVWMGENTSVKLGTHSDIFITVAQGKSNDIIANLIINPNLRAPIEAGKSYGTLKVMLGEEVLHEAPVVALESVAVGGLWRKISDTFSMTFSRFSSSKNNSNAS